MDNFKENLGNSFFMLKLDFAKHYSLLLFVTLKHDAK